ncbi:MAG: hypothetical protein ACREIW_12185 [Chthoniobacterales bacterium]
MSAPIICFGQQPCGFFPKRFLYAKILTARRLQKEIGGKIVFFYHDSDHDRRETITILCDRHSGREMALNFKFESKTQKLFSPLYIKRIATGWKEKMVQQLPAYVSSDLTKTFKAARGRNAADFCLDVYRQMGLLDTLQVDRSSDPQFRERAVAVSDYFVDIPFEGEIVRARRRDGKLWLHKGGDRYIEVPAAEYNARQISPTRDTRFRWMQSVVHCTHYVAGASEQNYINKADGPGVIFVERDVIADASRAWVGE